MNLKGLSLDPASSCGWAAGTEPQNITYGHFKIPKREVLGERLAFLHDRIDELIVREMPDLIIVENPFNPFHTKKPAEGDTAKPFMLSHKTHAFLENIRGIIHERAARHGVPLEAYEAGTWRRGVLGFARGAGVDMKQAMWNYAKQVLRLTPENTDESDAIGILLYGLTGEPAAKRGQASLLEVFGKRL